MNKMIGSFGPYCIFQMREGIFVRHETLSAHPTKPGKIKRSYRTINAVPVQTRAEADKVIEQAMLGPVADALAVVGKRLVTDMATAMPALCDRFQAEVQAAAPGLIAATKHLRGRLQ